MPRYPLYKAFYMSLYSKNLYVDVLRSRKATGFLYILLLSVFFAAVNSLDIYRNIAQFDTNKVADEITYFLFEDPDLTFEENVNRLTYILSSIPKISIENSKVNVDPQAPVFINDPKTGKSIAVIDTANKGEIAYDENIYAVLREDGVDIKNQNGFEFLKFSELGNIEALNNILPIVEQIPYLRLENGKAVMDENSPYSIYTKDQKLVAMIDLEGSYNSIDDVDARILITKDKLYYHLFEKGEIYLSDINSDMIFNLLLDSFDYWKKIFYLALAIILFPLLIIRSFIILSLLLFIFSLITLALSLFHNLRNFKYEDYLRITAFASSAPTFYLVAAPPVFPSYMITHIIVYLLLFIAYINFAVRANTDIR